jgi:hypothetical protein
MIRQVVVKVGDCSYETFDKTRREIDDLLDNTGRREKSRSDQDMIA